METTENKPVGFGKWLENFWYHYKVPFIAILLALVIVIVCSVQFCNKAPEADIKLVYGGEASLRPTSSEMPAENMVAALEGYGIQTNKGENATFDVYAYQIFMGDYIPSQSANQDNIEGLQFELDAGNAFLFLLDEKVYNTYTANASGDRYVVPVASYLSADSTAEVTPDGYGVYLRSLAIYQLPAFSSLPADTVLCLRVSFTFSNMLGASKTEEIYPLYEELFRRLINA